MWQAPGLISPTFVDGCQSFRRSGSRVQEETKEVLRREWRGDSTTGLEQQPRQWRFLDLRPTTYHGKTWDLNDTKDHREIRDKGPQLVIGSCFNAGDSGLGKIRRTSILFCTVCTTNNSEELPGSRTISVKTHRSSPFRV